MYIEAIVKKVFVSSLAFLFATTFSTGQAAKKTKNDLSSQKEAEEEDLTPTVQLVDLKYTLPSWVTVTGGSILCQPVRNSFGYAAVEEGKMVCAFDHDGKIMWERGINARLKPLISVGASDMIYIISKDGDLNMMNPGGLLVWTAHSGFSVTEAPLPGRDGRIYVRGGSDLACFGIKGICRWNIPLPEQNTSLPIVELNEGSVLVFLNKEVDGKSIAVTVTPFGEVSDEFCFSGKVVQVEQCFFGALVSFADGATGLCAEKDGKPYSKWAVMAGQEGLSAPTRIITEGFSPSTALLLTGSPATAIQIGVLDGSQKHVYKTDFSPDALTYAGRTLQGLVLADGSHACCYMPEGEPLWKATFNPSKKWTYFFPTDSGNIGLCMRDWVIEGYRIRQNIGFSPDVSSYHPKNNRDYNTFYDKTDLHSTNVSGPVISPERAEDILNSFSEGKFGTREKDWIPVLKNELSEMILAWTTLNSQQNTEQPFFCKDFDYTRTVLSLAANSGTGMYQKYYAELLEKVRDPVVLAEVIKSAGISAYDPDARMLSAMEAIAKKYSLKNSNESVHIAICDATFEICRFMGRPAFFAKGKTTITRLLSPQYGKATREYARKTLEKFIEIGF